MSAAFGRDESAWQAAWDALQSHHAEIESVHMRDLFRADPQRFERYSMVVDGGREPRAEGAENSATMDENGSARAEL